MQANLKGTPFPGNLAEYEKQMQAVKDLRSQFTTMAQASGAYSVETVKSVSATQMLSKSIADQKLTLSGALNNLKNFQNGWREQAALQKASLTQFTQSATGKNSADLYMPRELTSELDSFRNKYGYINQAIGSIATQTINWGKNTQWAGRQITVGLGMPIAMVMAGAAKYALDADKALTKITKVYNTTTDSSLTAAQQQISTQNQLTAVRKNAMTDAISMAKQYGSTMDETLATEAELAAVGKTGNDLRVTTAQVTRVATLGELDHNTALQMTISLQNAFKLSSKQLGDAFNYMNDIENTTSLTTKDFAEAIPRGAAAMASMGVNVQQMGILLVALKQGGVEATVGMNALKSATARILHPTTDAQKAFEGMKINIQNVVAEAGGNLFEVLKKLGPLMAGQSNQTRQAALAALFGTYQFNKLNVALDGVSGAYDKLNKNVKDPNDQVLQAAQVAAQDPTSWASVADQEQKQLQQSISFQWTSTISQLKVEMATLGQSVIGALLPIGKTVLDLVKWFNSWGDGSKKIALWVAGFMMLAGPAIMLVGLMANLAGNVVKFASSMSNLVLRFKVLDPEQRAAQLMAKQAGSAFDAEAGSIARLNLEMQNLIKTQLASANANGVVVPGLTGAAATVQRQMLANSATNTTGKSTSGAPVPIPLGGNRFRSPTTGRMMGAADVKAMQTAAAAADKAALETEAMANASARTGVNFGKMVGKLAMFGTAAWAMSGMLDSSGGLVSNLSMAALFVGTMAGSGGFKAIGGAIKGIPGLFRAAFSVVGDLAGKGALAVASAYGRAGGSIGAMFGKVGDGLLKFFSGPLGIITVLAGAAAIYMTIQNHIEKAARQQKAINDSTSQWANILGYAAKSWKNMEDAGSGAGSQTPTAWAARAEQVKKLNSEMVDGLKSAYGDGKNLTKVYNMAVDEAFKVKLDGGSAAQAKQAFEVALQAAGVTKMQFDSLDVKFNEVNVDDTAAIQKHVQDNLKSAFKDFGNGFDDIQESWTRPWADMSGQAEAAAGKVGGAFTEGLKASTSIDDVKAVVKTFSDNMNGEFMSEFNKIDKKNKDTLKKYGITNAQQYFAAMQKAWNDASKGTDHMSAQDKDVFAINTGDDHASNVGDYMRSVFPKALADVKDKLHLTDSQMKALEDSGYSTDALVQLLGRDMLGFASGTNAAVAAMNNLDGAQNTYNYNAQQVTDALKSTMKGYMSDVYAQAQNIMSEQYQNQVDGINKAGQARQRGFDAQGKALDKAQKAESDALKKSQDARTKAFDDQIKQTQDAAQAQEDGIQAQIDAEQKQDQTRQDLFNREKTRIERLNQLQNNNIDYNAALNSGNLDEAAKAYNNNMSTVQSWQVDDQNTAASAASKALQDSQSAQIKSIKDITDAKVKQLQDQKDALKDVFDYETQLLEDKQQKEKDALDAAKQADSDRTASAVASAQKRQAMNKLELDQEVMALKAQTPRTKEEAQAQIDQLQAIYKKYGVSLNANAEEWSQYIANDLTAQVGTAAAGLQNDVDWTTLGNNITTLLGNGAGMSADQLKGFLATGQWPASLAPPVVNAATGMYVGGDGKIHQGRKAVHSGGFMAPSGKLSWTQKERMGVPANASPYQSEIPTLLKHGEFVVNDKATSQHLPLLNAINSGQDISGLFGARHLGGSALLGGNARNITDSFGGIMEIALANRFTALYNSRLQALGKRTAPLGDVPLAPTDVTGNKAIVQGQAANDYGWTGREWDALYKIIMMESGFKNTAQNPTSTAFGMFQFLNSTWKSYGIPKTSDPALQTKAGLSYIKARYGDPLGALQHEQQFHWYDNGGMFKPGTIGLNATGKPEPVFTSEQWALISRLVSSAGSVMASPTGAKSFDSGTTNHYDVTIDLRGAVVKDDIDFKGKVKEAMYEINNQNGLNRKVGNGS